MKFVILTDIHLGPEGYWNGVLRKVNKEAKLYLSNFVEEMNNKVKPEFVVILGDLIEDNGIKNDQENIAYVVSLLSKLNCTVYYVAGNHDLHNLSEDELARIFRQDKLYYSFDHNNIHFIVLFSRVIREEISEIDEQQLEWLEEDLEQTNQKAILFVHHGLADQNLKGNPWFEKRPDYALIENRNKVRSIIESSNKVLAVFNSHIHWNNKDIHNSIPYYTIQSLTENEDDKGIASEAYAIVDILGSKVSVKIEGKYSKELK